ncbi:MAG: DUF177 domain-containing protein [Clostridium sp.]|nr:DUF177 domain-containing protein [Clostridium sp.]
MKIDITDILKNDGSSLEVEFEKALESTGSIPNDVTIDRPVYFKGGILNSGGIIRLEGELIVDYTAKCSRCLQKVPSKIRIAIEENFVKEGYTGENNDEMEDQYTYQGRCIDIKKAMLDNIILSLPARHVCSDDCKGFCFKCGINLNNDSCDCQNKVMDPRMKVLKNLFENKAINHNKNNNPDK